MIKSFRDILESALAQERRRAVADWRALSIFREAEVTIPRSERRWEKAPFSIEEVGPVLRRMVTSGQLARIPGVSGVFEVRTPYASTLQPLQPLEVAFEANPFASVVYLSALVFHGLSTAFPRQLQLLIPRQRTSAIGPPGTPTDSHISLSEIHTRAPKTILGQEIVWYKTHPQRLLGLQEYSPSGYPIRVASIERALFDCLARPEESGGWNAATAAWEQGWDRIDPEALCTITDQMGIAVMRQRIGFALERFGFRSDRLDRWASRTSRGGSSRLLSGHPFSSRFDSRWNLSINAPVEEFGQSTT